MKKHIVTFVVAAVLILSGCELITGNDGKSTSDDSTTSTPSVHGKVVLTVAGGSTLPGGSKIHVEVQYNPSALVSKATARVAAQPTYTKEISVSASGTYSYAITNVPDGVYTATFWIVDGSGTALTTESVLKSDVTVTGKSATVPDVSLSYPDATS